VVEDRYEWTWLYAAVEPATGEGFSLLRPGVGQAWFQAFLAEFGKAAAGRRVGLVPDGAGSHRAAVAWPGGVAPVPLPPYSPELNPAEQGFRALRAKLANRVFEDLAELEAALTEQLRAFWDRPAALRRLTAYPWWQTGAAAITPLSP
jgi:transposase